jgi:hypothetical protein
MYLKAGTRFVFGVVIYLWLPHLCFIRTALCQHVGAANVTKIQQAKQLLEAIDAAIARIITSGAQSASLSSGGGAKSYTNLSLAELREMRRETLREIAAYNAGGKRPITMTGVRFV